MKLEQITVRRLNLPLKVPYKLSLAVLHTFDTLLVELQDDQGRTGYGEATILHGYTPETIEQAWQEGCKVAQTITGMDTDTATSIILPSHAQLPFMTTAFITAMEMLGQHPLLSDYPSASRVPLLAVINQESGSGLQDEISRLLADGYKTFKVKVGFDVASDAERVARIQAAVAGRAQLRLDGNQGYSKEEALRFIRQLNPEGIELLEQPCHADDWDAAQAAAKVSGVPLMLDESIYGLQDIERAARLGCATYIKLKLMKTGSLDSLAQALERIRELNMKPVLGNGVAGDISCWMEACVAYRLIDNAGEMNGFLKPQQQLLVDPLEVSQGSLVLPTQHPQLCAEKLNAVTLEKVTFGSTAR